MSGIYMMFKHGLHKKASMLFFFIILKTIEQLCKVLANQMSLFVGDSPEVGLLLGLQHSCQVMSIVFFKRMDKN